MTTTANQATTKTANQETTKIASQKRMKRKQKTSMKNAKQCLRTVFPILLSKRITTMYRKQAHLMNELELGSLERIEDENEDGSSLGIQVKLHYTNDEINVGFIKKKTIKI